MSVQHFHANVFFLYKKTRKKVQNIMFPDFDGMTDWGARLITAPVVEKQCEDWTGKPTVSAITFSLADTDGQVTSTLGARLGDPVAMYFKASENPPSYWAAFEGNITKTTKSKGLYTITVSDSVKNVYNSAFVPDYMGLATTIDGKLYGTVKDVIGTNVYLDDGGDVRWICQRVDGDNDWTAALVGGAFGALFGLVTGGLAAPVVGGLSGIMQNAPRGGAYVRHSIQVNDKNILPDNAVLGGQNLKFYPGTVSGWATRQSGPLYSQTMQQPRGGTFCLGIYGTLYMDDLLHGVQKGDYIYAELPLLYRGSPDDIIIAMLTGRNTTVPYTYPDDFSHDWFSQSAPLRHIDAYAVVDNFEGGGVVEVINNLAEEFGFNFFVDESNRFALRTARERSIGNDIIGTFREDYNIHGDTEVTNDIETSFTDMTIKYKDTFLGENYGMEVKGTFESATYFGAMKRLKEINSKWIHDKLTGEYLMARMKRRYTTPVPKVTFQAPLYASPLHLGELIRISGYAVGSMVPYEVTRYAKNFGNSSAEVTAECVGSYYGTFRYAYLDDHTLAATCAIGYGPTLPYGALVGTLNDTDTSFEVYGGPTLMAIPNGALCGFLGGDGGEVMQVIGVEGAVSSEPLQRKLRYRVKRGAMHSQPQYQPYSGVTLRFVIQAPHRSTGDNSQPFIWY